MGRLAVVVMLLGNMSAFGQLLAVDGFKKNKHGLYEMSFKDVRDAVRKYNYVSDMNGADTNDVVFDIMKNPIDFAFFGNNIESQIISLMIVDGDRYKIMFGEFDGSEDKDFFTVISEKNRPLNLIYRVK
jgi:hypothetical protein